MNSTLIVNFFRFIALLAIQIIVFNNMNFYGYINPFPYILFIILYPVNGNKTGLLASSFMHLPYMRTFISLAYRWIDSKLSTISLDIFFLINKLEILIDISFSQTVKGYVPVDNSLLWTTPLEFLKLFSPDLFFFIFVFFNSTFGII